MIILLLLANSLAITGSNIEDKINILLADTFWERNSTQIKKLADKDLWIATSAFAALNLAHWIFAMKYWSIAVRTGDTKPK